MKVNDRSIVLGRARAIGCGAAVLTTLMAAAAWAEEAAWAAQIRRQADALIVLLHSYESKPIIVDTPCEERHHWLVQR